MTSRSVHKVHRDHILGCMQLTAVLATDAGMHALWDTDAFGMIDGYEAWARELDADEKPRVVVSSEVYRLTTSGRVGVSGIEYVGPVDKRVSEGMIEAGEYDAIVHLMDYDDVAARGNEHPDFVITLGPTAAGVARTAIETFASR
jgi:hypothetical protein